MNQYIEYSKEVIDALQNKRPIVAIETGGTFAGIPYPENVETAKKVSEEIRLTGAGCKTGGGNKLAEGAKSKE